ncbi:MAG: hypothetical protein QOE61_4583, partial [Micromonosporaceae bacterium]|nr:hypothetical protein [Micromonosporaceae bacterium]
HSITVAPTSAWGAERVIVTGLRIKPGDVLKAGQVLAEVSGRPVVLLPGAVPAYRDLRPGAAGADITQLQDALRGLGYSIRGENKFGPATKTALTKLYETIGFPAADTGEADNRAVADARKQVAAATDALHQAQQAPDRSGVVAAQAALTAARSALADLVARTGVMLPLGEMIFAPSFPVRVVSVPAVVGREIQGAVAILATGDVIAAGTLAGNDAQGVAKGQPAQILVSSGGQSMTGTVDAAGPDAAALIASGSGSGSGSTGGGSGSGQGSGSGSGGTGEGAGPTGFAVVVSADNPIDAKLVGQAVRITVTVASTATPVFVVPISAVSAAADEQETVTIVDDAGARRTIPVIVGHAGEGYVEVSPAAGATLAAGDHVVVGVR